MTDKQTQQVNDNMSTQQMHDGGTTSQKVNDGTTTQKVNAGTTGKKEWMVRRARYTYRVEMTRTPTSNEFVWNRLQCHGSNQHAWADVWSPYTKPIRK